jgi:hypothetical protein
LAHFDHFPSFYLRAVMALIFRSRVPNYSDTLYIGVLADIHIFVSRLLDSPGLRWANISHPQSPSCLTLLSINYVKRKAYVTLLRNTWTSAFHSWMHKSFLMRSLRNNIL